MTAIETAGLRKAFGPRKATGKATGKTTGRATGTATGEVQALDGLSLSVPCGTVCALLGPNGAGKSTAIRILATLTKPDAGRAIVAGHDVIREPRQVRELIGLAGQHAAVDDDLTGRENLFILGLMHHLGRAGAKTTGLDPRSRAEIWSAIRALAGHGTTILLTTQYLDEADQLSGQIVIIDRGRTTAQGTPGELKDALGSRIDVTVADPRDLPAAAAVVQRLTQHPPATDDTRRRLSTPVTAGLVTLPELVRQLDAAGVAAEDVSLRRPTLDEVFLDRTGKEAA